MALTKEKTFKLPQKDGITLEFLKEGITHSCPFLGNVKRLICLAITSAINSKCNAAQVALRPMESEELNLITLDSELSWEAWTARA